MKLLFALLLLTLLAGCSISSEEKDFYYSGWLNPNAPARWKSGMQSGLPPAGSIDQPISVKPE